MDELTVNAVREWIRLVPTGQFHYTKILDGAVHPDSYAKLREYVARCCKDGIAEPTGNRDGTYRRVEALPLPVNWEPINPNQDSGLILPFNLRKYVWIDPNTSVVVAGSKDSGKSGFLMRTVYLNMGHRKVIFLCNMEGGINQLKRRFEAMGVDMTCPPFETYTVTENFHDAMKETGVLYVVDYIDVPDTGEFFMIAPALSRIQVKLYDNTNAVIGLQKKTNSDLAYGGEQTLKKTTLYLAMNPGKIKIVSAKIHANPTIDPKNMQWTFLYSEEGTRFDNVVQAVDEI